MSDPAWQPLKGLFSSLQGKGNPHTTLLPSKASQQHGTDRGQCPLVLCTVLVVACVWLKLSTRSALFWSHGKTLNPFVWH